MKVAIVKNDIGLIPLEEFRDAIDVATAVLNFCNEYTPPFSIADYTGIDATAIDLSKQWSYDFSLSQLIETTHKIDVVVPVSLDTFKDEIILQLEEKRDDRFNSHRVLSEYPELSGKMFSCSIGSRNDWGNLEIFLKRKPESYPIKAPTFDKRDYYEIVDDAALAQIVGAIGLKVLEEMALYNTYTKAVFNAVDESAVSLAAKPYLNL